MLRLAALEGFPAGAEFDLGPRPLTIGRDPTCDVVLDDEDVSREHCRFRPGGDGFLVEDLGSSNGTIVNGQRITQPVSLRPGDLVVIGPALLEVHEAAPSAEPERPPERRRSAAASVAPLRAAAQADHDSATTSLSTSVREAVLAGQRVQRDVARLQDQLGRLGNEPVDLLNARSRAEASAPEAEVRRLLDRWQRAAASSQHDLIGALDQEIETFATTVSAALELLQAVRTRCQ